MRIGEVRVAAAHDDVDAAVDHLGGQTPVVVAVRVVGDEACRGGVIERHRRHEADLLADGLGLLAHGQQPVALAGSVQDRNSGAARRGAPASRGYTFLHHAVDSYSRLAYSEQLPDERKETAAAFWKRARAFFADAGVENAKGPDRRSLDDPGLAARP